MSNTSDHKSDGSSNIAAPGSGIYYNTKLEASNEFGEDAGRETDLEEGSEVSNSVGSSEAEVKAMLQTVDIDDDQVANDNDGAEEEEDVLCKFCRDNNLVCKLAWLEMTMKLLKCTNCKVQHCSCTLDFSVHSKNTCITKQEEQYNKGKLNAINDEFRATISCMHEHTNTSKLITALKSHIAHLKK